MLKKQGKAPGKKSPSTKPSRQTNIRASKPKTQKSVKVHRESKRDREERNWGMYCHLAAFAGFIVPFGNIIGPFIVWLIKREDFPTVNRQGKEALNFQISMTLYFFVATLLTFIIIGFILIPVIVIADIIFIIMAAIKAQEGGIYRYPLTIHFLK